ncbi:4-carboxy-4-hydroxy-2-oxoadipate aldolase/oxaloacetate decarboxylase [Arthrobacter sp. I2-34]|uniref:Putative 4-hydroxy-4-methyl-2-oxoglutarate aldolase n=1 Tax=Arthrobacter hankyongi TaxID=2904801 RepID=A0ABS9L4C9_9MICC|nr:4-carboxy-4-hydroxy-2-oxoadipate aldolase/oxaloacetate decarboxylase [Arthrobacter hankyongi]MCG2621344.1 4-carboxy-4-hydroxy-2-oxoadipate aldolase/oxaloacetate decarboxylase [Arthrobacter hankyongi]
MSMDKLLASGQDLVEAAGVLPTATLHEAGGKIGALPAAIKPVRPGMRLAGTALPVLCPPGDNLWLHRAVYEADPGEVLVVDVGEAMEHGHWGEVLAVAAQKRGIAGLVINGGVRDGDQLLQRGFPVFSASISIRGTAKDPYGAGAIGEPVRIGGVEIRRGDLVVGDADGVVVVPADQAAAVIEKSVQREADEQDILARLAAGECSLDIYSLPKRRDR